MPVPQVLNLLQGIVGMAVSLDFEGPPPQPWENAQEGVVVRKFSLPAPPRYQDSVPAGKTMRRAIVALSEDRTVFSQCGLPGREIIATLEAMDRKQSVVVLDVAQVASAVCASHQRRMLGPDRPVDRMLRPFDLNDRLAVLAAVAPFHEHFKRRLPATERRALPYVANRVSVGAYVHGSGTACVKGMQPVPSLPTLSGLPSGPL